MSLTIIRQDITKLDVDVIVNPINQEFLVDGGVCQAIFEKAGKEQLIQACKKLPPLKTSEVVITDGFDLRAKHIIHTTGPIYKEEDSQKCESLLVETYRNCLKLASENNLESIAFPLISSGLYGFPKEQALEIARKTITTYLKDNDLEVVLTIFDKESFAISETLLGEVASYISENYVEQILHKSPTNRRKASFNGIGELGDLAEDCVVLEESSIEDVIDNLDEPFSQSLLTLIDVKGKTDVEVYKKANIDRKLFSKIRTKKDYNPSKRTILALSISLELSLGETNALLEKAGYILSHSHKLDVIVEYFIVNKKYDIFAINEVLFKYDQALLGC